MSTTKENRNILILGASVAGLSAAHYIAKHVLPKLNTSSSSPATYTLHLIDPSTHFWWHIAAPREIVSVKRALHADYFVPIADGFKQYAQAVQDRIVFHQGTATGLDSGAREVTVKKEGGVEEKLGYYALILATGVRSPTAATTLQGAHEISQRELERLNKGLEEGQEIVIGGGGPIGVETAGEIGYAFLGRGKKITLYAGGERLLPVLAKKRAEKAETLLAKVGVKVVYGVKIQGTREADGGKTVVELSDGKTVEADVYIPCVGVQPNTEFLPAELKDGKGYVSANKETGRVEAAGERVYAVGDVAAMDRGGVLNFYNSFPVTGANIAHDLLAADKIAGAPTEKKYTWKDSETQFVPVGPKTGVAAFNGWGIPGFMVAQAKGKDYLKANIPEFTLGTKWNKV